MAVIAMKGRTVTPVTPAINLGPTPAAQGRAMAMLEMIDRIKPMAEAARGSVGQAEAGEQREFAEARAATLEGSVAKLRGALREAGVFG